MTAPDPKTVREIAREQILNHAKSLAQDDVTVFESVIEKDVCIPLSIGEQEELADAVLAEIGRAQVAVSWPDEQQPAEAERQRKAVAPEPEPIGGWLLWGPTGRWMASATWTTEERRRDDGWRAVSINDAEAQEFRSKGCFLDALDRAGWRAFKELSGFLDVDGKRDQWLAKRADLAAQAKQQPAETTGGEQAQDGAVELTLTAIRRRALTASTYAEWHQVARDVETLIKLLAAATERADLAEAQVTEVQAERNEWQRRAQRGHVVAEVLRADLAAATARAEKAEARLTELGEPEVEQRIVSPSGQVYEPTLRDLENQAHWLPGTRLEERQVYPTPWRVGADAAPDGQSATETGGDEATQ